MKSRTKVIALAGILGIAGIGGTFAYFSQDETKSNVFKTGTYNTTLVEEFNPKDGENWKPGAKVNKDVAISNEGSLPVVVRVKFKERWFRTEDGKENVLYSVDTTDGMASVDPSTSEIKFEHVYQSDKNDGLVGTDRDDSVVHKTLDPDGNWIYNPADGYYYYKYLLPGKEKDGEAAKTSLILDEIRLDADIDMGAYIEKRYYREGEESQWVEFDIKNEAATPADARYYSTEELVEQGKKITSMKSVPVLVSEKLNGYNQADYILTIVAETVQATDNAVQSIFEIDDLTKLQAELGLEWSGILAEDELYSGDKVASLSEASPSSAE